MENFQNNKVKIKPTLHSWEMKLLKFEYTSLNVLKPLLVLVIKTSKKDMEILCFSHR